MKQNPITEAIQEEHGATPPTAQEILDFIRDSGAIDGGETFVKVLEFSQMQGSISSGLKAFDVYHESSDNTVHVVAPSDSSVNVIAGPDTEDELLAEDLANDLDAAIQHRASWGGLPFKITITQNSTGVTPGYAIWDDRTNVIYLVRNMPGSGISWQYVRNAVEHFGDYLHELNNNYNADNSSLMDAIEHITPEDNAENPEMYQLLVSFLPRRLWSDVTAPAPAANQGQNGQHAADDDDVIDVTPEEPEAQDAPAAEEPEQPAAAPAETPEQDADGTDGYESVNGIKFAGEWNKTADGQPGDTFSVMFGPWPISQFKQRMQAFPSNALQALFDKPVKYKELANSEYDGVRVFGNASGASEGYTDVCRNYMFFVCNNSTEIRWGMTRRGHKIFFKWDHGPTPSDMWYKLSGSGNGNDFIGFFYRRCRTEVRNAIALQREAEFTPIWDAANAASAATSSTSRQSAQTANSATNLTKPMTANERRKFIEEVIYKRLLDELGQAPHGNGTADDYVEIPIVKASDTQQILVGTSKHRKTRFTPKACRNLARNYDDWAWAAVDPNQLLYAKRQHIARINQKLDRLLNPTGIEPPPPKEVIKPEPEEQKKLDQAMAAVNGKLKGTGIEAQVTAPGHKPQYNYIQELGSRQGEGWPKDDKRYFVVTFTGLDTAKVFGDEAKTWLQKMRLLKYVQSAFDAAKEVYPEIQWAVVSDNGLPK